MHRSRYSARRLNRESNQPYCSAFAATTKETAATFKRSDEVPILRLHSPDSVLPQIEKELIKCIDRGIRRDASTAKA